MMKTTKYLLFCISLLMVAAVCNAQSKRQKKGAHQYHRFSYAKAIDIYEPINNKPAEVKREMGESYYISGNIEQALNCWESVATSTEAKPFDFYRYAFMLRANGKYAESEKWIRKFGEVNTADSRAKEYLADPGADVLLQKDEGRFIIRNMDFNSDQEDFGTAYYLDKIVFASSRHKVKPVLRRWNGNGLSFLNIYVIDAAEGGKIKSIHPLSKKLNKKYHDGPASFSKDGKWMVFTRNNYDAKSSDRTTNLQLYSAELIDGKWQNKTSLPFNNKEYSTGQPCLTPDGKTLYFSSDMPGGMGGTDLYKSLKQADGTWSIPVSLGNTINTEGNEMFPFYHLNGILFFASDGHVGLGGLDIFLSQVKDNDFGKPVNLGATANTNRDDFAFILDDEMKTGYLSSNRDGGKGDDDIYTFTLSQPFKFKKTIKGTAKDKQGISIPNAIIKLMDKDGKEIAKVNAGEDGTYSFSAEPDKEYKLSGNKEKYYEGTNTAKTFEKVEVVIADVILDNAADFSLYFVVTDRETKELLEGVKIQLTNNFTMQTEEYTTASTGDLRKALNENKLNDRISYDIRLEKPGYLIKTVTYKKLLSRPGQYNVHEDLDVDLDRIEIGLDLTKIVDIKPIYFDLGKYNIRKDAALELNKIIKVMNDNPNMEIELGSHTDCRSSMEFNQILSTNRANASAAYIRAKISNPQRIYGKGYGETKPVNDCRCEGKVISTCSEAEHQQNRRTEFIIVKM